MDCNPRHRHKSGGRRCRQRSLCSPVARSTPPTCPPVPSGWISSETLRRAGLSAVVSPAACWRIQQFPSVHRMVVTSNVIDRCSFSAELGSMEVPYVEWQ